MKKRRIEEDLFGFIAALLFAVFVVPIIGIKSIFESERDSVLCFIGALLFITGWVLWYNLIAI